MSLEGMAHKGKYGQQKSHTAYTVNPPLSPQGEGGALIYFKPI